MYQTESEPKFNDALNCAFQTVRGAFTDLLASVQADPNYPQDIARRFGINKNLAWKISKIVTVTDPHTVVPNLPGNAGINTILTAFEERGAPASAVAAARSAIEEFDDMVEVHVGDRSTLQLVLSSNAPDRVPPEQLAATRKMAFQGNSAIWGVQARVRLASFFLAPNPDDPTLVDTASVGGLIDVRRFRADASIPFYNRFAYNDDGTPRDKPAREPIDPAAHDDPLTLMREFCSSPLPQFHTLHIDGHTRYQLPPGPIGNRGKHTWIYGEAVRAFAPIHRDATNQFGEHAVQVQCPVEWLLCDIQVHESLAFALTPRVLTFGLHSFNPKPGTETEYDRLPVPETIQSIGHGPPIVSTPLVPHYQAMVQRVYERMHWRASEMHGFRFEMKYPPMPMSVVIQHDLADPNQA